MTGTVRPAAWVVAIALLGSPAGCSNGGECATVAHVPSGTFTVTLRSPDGPLPGDLVITLHWAGVETTTHTLPDILGDPAYDPRCWDGEHPAYASADDAGAAEPVAVTCSWGLGSVGMLQATASGYRDIAIVLFSEECEDCCEHWSREYASADLQPR